MTRSSSPSGRARPAGDPGPGPAARSPDDPSPRSARGVLLAALLLLPASVAPIRAQETGTTTLSDSTATLSGQVVSAMTGGPLASARVALKTSGRGAITDSTGEFTLQNVPAGSDTVHVSLIGFAEQQVPLTLKPDHVTRVTLLLSEAVLKVEDITVTVEEETRGKLSGFEERMQRGFGHFITPEEIEERNPQHGSDLLRMVPGVSVGAYQFGRAPVRITRRSSGNCDPIYFVDGVAQQHFHIDELNRDDIMAIEVYRGPSETPPQFLFRYGGCGAIVIWTQEGGRQ